jgi:hypothetical protein
MPSSCREGEKHGPHFQTHPSLSSESGHTPLSNTVIRPSPQLRTTTEKANLVRPDFSQMTRLLLRAANRNFRIPFVLCSGDGELPVQAVFQLGNNLAVDTALEGSGAAHFSPEAVDWEVQDARARPERTLFKEPTSMSLYSPVLATFANFLLQSTISCLRTIDSFVS